MIVEDLDFHDWDQEQDHHLMPDCEESCLRIIRATAHVMCEGQVPGDSLMRLGLLFSVVAKLAIECGQAVRAEKKREPGAREHIEMMANITMSRFIAAAARWAAVVEQNSNTMA